MLHLLRSSIAALGALLLLSVAAPAQERPNFLFVLVDNDRIDRRCGVVIEINHGRSVRLVR